MFMNVLERTYRAGQSVFSKCEVIFSILQALDTKCIQNTSKIKVKKISLLTLQQHGN